MGRWRNADGIRSRHVRGDRSLVPGRTGGGCPVRRVRQWWRTMDRAEALLFVVQAVVLWKISNLPS